MNLRLLFFLLAGFSAGAQVALQSPTQFLGYEPGTAFTRHHRVVEYFRHVDEAMPNVSIVQYGETYERRPLIVAIVSSPENAGKIDHIREDNLRRAGMLQGNGSGNTGIVWLSYNVHGNEGNSTETSMRTLYELVNPQNNKSKEWLKNTVVIIDPCINPDGRDRYANFYNQYGNFPPNTDPQAREHREPWPGGRPNHYLFDLNRDWAWLTQQESRARLALYNKWMPQVHVDFHEQGYNSPYYFAPAAEPYHEVITPWQRKFQDMIGRNNAGYFDKQGWLYFSKERFDLYYPSYGDTYPVYSGAIGMTYEQGGIGAGLLVTTKEGDPMTLKDRVDHHYTTGMSTIETASRNMDRLLEEYGKFFQENLSNPAAPYKTYVIKGDNNPDKLSDLSRWLTAHGVVHGFAPAAKQTRGFDFTTRQQGNVSISTGDLVFNIHQPKGRFITTVFEPQSKLTDSLTYDITAWNLIYAFGLKAHTLTERINPGAPWGAPAAAALPEGSPYAYACRYGSIKDAAFLAALHKIGVKVRLAMRSFTTGGQTFEPGTLLITRRNNEGISGFDGVVKELAIAHGRTLHAIGTGYMDAGPDMGSADFVYLNAPKVALLGGDQTNSQNHGQAWHFFEEVMHYPVSVLGTDYFRSVDLWQYQVLVIPEGNYQLFDEELLTTINRWVGDGGRLILIGSANNAFADKKGFSLKTAEQKKAEPSKEDMLLAYGDRERKELSSALFGAIYKVSMDKTHPLAFGIGETYFSLKTSPAKFPWLEKGANSGTLRGKANPLMGFAGKKANAGLENTLVFGSEDRGPGRVIYLIDNQLFREFWETGKLMFANAVFLGGASY
ncbi:MAG: M14 family metallopeptidase [Bacteroidota bacterium]